MENSLVKFICILLSIAVLVGIVANSLPTFYWTDDFSFRYALSKFGVFEFVWNMYNGWDGRHLTPSGITQAFFIKYTNAPTTTFVWTIGYITSFYVLSKRYFASHIFITTALFGASFLILYQSHLFQTLYWSVGGLYSMILLIGALWLFCYRYKSLNRYYVYAISFIAGATTQNLSVCLLTIVFIDISIDYYLHKKVDNQLFIVLGLLLLGTLFISLAPGSRLRAGVIKDVWTFQSKLQMMQKVYFDAIILTKPIYFIAPVIGLITYKIRKTSDGEFLLFIKYLIAGAFSLVPFVLLPPMMSAEARTTMFFQFFVFLSFLHLSWYVLGLINATELMERYRLNVYNRIVPLLACAVLSAAITLLFFNFMSGMKVKADYIEREKHILNSNEVNLIIEPINFVNGRGTYMHYFFDMTSDPQHSFNLLASQYYLKNSIKVRK